MKIILYSLFCMLSLASCSTIAPFERQYLSDPEMQMGLDAGQEFNNYVHSIREGSSPAASIKSSGGCGCK